jgi:hypothetical protein
VKKDWIDRGSHGSLERCVQNVGLKSSRERNNLENLRVDGNIILKSISEKCVVKLQTV